jgi:hypothetical protein
MPPTYADCPVCGFECKVDDDLVAQPIECPKCKKSFTVEVGESYGVAGASPSRPGSSDPVVPDTGEFEPEASEGQGGKSWLEAWPQD